MVLYSIVPWVGVMAAGYAFGAVVASDAARRRRLCLRIGLSAVALFWSCAGSICTATRVHGECRATMAARRCRPCSPSSTRPSTRRRCFPADDARTDHRAGAAARDSAVGPLRVADGLRPRAVLLLHAPHPVDPCPGDRRVARHDGCGEPLAFRESPDGQPARARGYTWSLGLLYLVWVAAIVLLYFPCRWFADFKARRHDWWLSYL